MSEDLIVQKESKGLSMRQSLSHRPDQAGIKHAQAIVFLFFLSCLTLTFDNFSKFIKNFWVACLRVIDLHFM